MGIKDVPKQAIINGCLQIFNFVIALGASFLVESAGRRPLFLLSNTGMLASMFIFDSSRASNNQVSTAFSAWTVTNALYNTLGNVSAAKATIPLIFLFFFFYDIAYTPMIVAYTLEILPFRVRAKGFAVMVCIFFPFGTTCARHTDTALQNLTLIATVAFNQFVNPWALEAISWKYYVVYCGWLVFELIFIFLFIVETKGQYLTC